MSSSSNLLLDETLSESKNLVLLSPQKSEVDRLELALYTKSCIIQM